MIGQQATSHAIITGTDLKVLANTTGTCITVVVLLPTPDQIKPRFKNAVRPLQKKLDDYGVDKVECAGLLAPIYDLITTIETEGVWAQALILFRSSDVFRYYWVHGQVEDCITVGERFQVRPLLRVMARDQRFHMLALSRQHVRLFHCTHHRADEMVIRGSVPQNMAEWMETSEPDHLLENRSSGGPSIGRMKGVSFGSNADRDREQRYLSHFLKDVEKGIHSILEFDTAPLILAGVEHELAIYRKFNRYRWLMNQAVEGSPQGLPSSQLHARAMGIIQATFCEALQKAVASITGHIDASRVVKEPRAAIQAAWQGRVLDLLIAENAQVLGRWNAETQEIEPGGEPGDLLNTAALETVRHGGQAFMLNPAEMPVQSSVAAVLRF